MKKFVVFMVGVGTLASIALAQDVVTSVNIVGCLKHTFERGKLHLVATAFEDVDGRPRKAADVFGTQLPRGAKVYYYDQTKTPPGYVTDNYNFSGWTTNITYGSGMGFWVEIPATAASPTYEVMFMGQVPMTGSHTNYVATGLNLLGFPYTCDVAFTNTMLYSNSKTGDKLHVYAPGQGYTTYSKTFAGWGAAKTLVLNQDMGFWFQTSQQDFLNIESRPYNP